MDEIGATLSDELRASYEHLMKLPASPIRDALVDALLCLADPVRARLAPDYRVEYDKALRMAPSPMRDSLIQSLLRMADGQYDYFDWNGTAVRVACSGGACQTFRDGAWHDGGPSRTVRDEECEALTREALSARYPAAANV